MPDWTKSMTQTYEYYIVDPGTWKDMKRINVIKSSSIKRDSKVETRGSASFEVTEKLSECYIRTYLVTVQNGVTEKHVLGTHLVQTPSSKFNGRIANITLDGYTSLLELKENQPPIGFFVPKTTKEDPVNVMEQAYMIARDNARAPVIKTECPSEVSHEFVADSGDTWITYISDLIANQVYEDVRNDNKTRVTKYQLDVDELGQIMFTPVQEIAVMQPIWTYTDDNSSILYPDISMEHDLYGIPNVVEITYSSNGQLYYARVENNDPNSPLSTISRGRKISYRAINPTIGAGSNPTQAMVSEYASQLLESLSSLHCTVSYTHGYCPVRVGDCVLLNYSRAGITNIKAKVISQDIKCTPGCSVTETAEFYINLLPNKIKFVNEKGELVNKFGQLIDENGDIIPEKEEEDGT
jgi:hypothetical protein